MVKTPTKIQQLANAQFKARLLQSQNHSQSLQNTFKTPTASEDDLEYWFLFVTGNYITGDRRKYFIRSYSVTDKIEHMKKDGTWPPEPARNQNLTGLFQRAYPDFKMHVPRVWLCDF